MVQGFVGHSSIGLLARCALGLVFLAAALGKIGHEHHFASAVAAYRLPPQFCVGAVAYLLPRLEIVLGVMLLLGWKARLAAALAGAALVVFTAAMGINLARGRRDLDCGCFGKHRRQTIGGLLLLRDSLLTLLALPVTIWGGGYAALDRLSPGAQACLDALLTMAIAPLALIVCGLEVTIRLARQLINVVRIPQAEGDS